MAAQARGLAVVSRLQGKFSAHHIVLSTHGNLLALILQHFDLTIDYRFWRSLTMPDIFRLGFTPHDETVIGRLWQENKLF